MNSPSTYHDRYLAGDHDAVWAELTNIPNIAASPHYHDAQRIARDIIDRTLHNLHIIHDHLCAIDVPFNTPNHVIVEANDTTAAGVAHIQQHYGQLPLILSAWFERIHAIDFGISTEHYEHGIGPQTTGIMPCDSLNIMSPQDCYAESVALYKACLEGNQQIKVAWEANPELNEYDMILNDEDPTFLVLGPPASNCEAKGVHLPSLAADTVYYDDGEKTTFVEDLRHTFSSGGLTFQAFSPVKGGYIKATEQLHQQTLAILLPKLRPI